MKKILVISPHADDAELGVGGYLYREVVQNQSADALIVVLAHGDYKSTVDGEKVTTEIRVTEAHAACKVLGLGNRTYFAHAAIDSQFNTTPMGDLVRAIEKALDGYNPDELFFPLPSFHDDHNITHKAVIAALRPHPNRKFPQAAYCYEYPGQGWGPQPPEWGRVFAELNQEALDKKNEALSCYQSQWASKTKSLFGFDGVRALARLRGAEMHRQYAEMYWIRSDLGNHSQLSSSAHSGTSQ